MPTADGNFVSSSAAPPWCASQHIATFLRNPRTTVTWLCARDAEHDLNSPFPRRCDVVAIRDSNAGKAENELR